MTDRYTQPPFDHDPTLDQPLKEQTRQFLTLFREEVRQRGEFLLNQTIGDPKPDGSSHSYEGVWTKRFVDRILGVKTLKEADTLLLPWIEWNQFHDDLYEESSKQGESTGERINIYEDRFKPAGIPPALKEQRAEMSEHDFFFNAKYYLFRFTKVTKEAIDMLEEVPKPVSAQTVLRVQRTTDLPHFPVGGLLESVKPNIGRRIIDGKPYITLFPDDEELKNQLDEDEASEADWERWEALEIGTHVRNTQQGNSVTFDKKFSEGGNVVGFDLVGAGDLMYYQPGIKNIVVYVHEDGTGFLRFPLLRQLALDTEPITIHHYTDLPLTRAATTIGTIDFREGTVTEVEIPDQEVADYIGNEAKKKLIVEKEPEE